MGRTPAEIGDKFERSRKEGTIILTLWKSRENANLIKSCENFQFLVFTHDEVNMHCSPAK